MTSLAGKNILIVGASRGIGQALATEAATQGATVFTASRQASGPRSAVIDTKDAFAFPPDFLPQELHGLVYCPGSITLKPLGSLKAEAVQEEFNLNVVGALRALQAALPALKRGGNGSVVFFSTVAAKVGMPFHASIAAAKGGLEAMARSAAAELAPFKIRVNVLAPSLTDTPLAAHLLDTEDKRAASAKRHPLGRVGTSEELAASACYLLSDAAAFMTAQTLGIDGGLGSLR
jgi:NAD(P)-dependent dehydrogenase (short-subunit alcohol dehydrogenase family)